MLPHSQEHLRAHSLKTSAANLATHTTTSGDTIYKQNILLLKGSQNVIIGHHDHRSRSHQVCTYGTAHSQIAAGKQMMKWVRVQCGSWPKKIA